MDRPKQSTTNEFRVWARKRFCVRRYIHETLGMSNYGKHGFTKLADQENHQYNKIKVYADDLLANAVMDAMPEDANPYDYCEELFGIETELSIGGVSTPERKERKSYKDPAEQAKEAFKNMDEETKEIFLDIIDQSND